jgi:hypothetical protein
VLNILGFEGFLAALAKAIASDQYALVTARHRIWRLLGAFWLSIAPRPAIAHSSLIRTC